MSSNLRLIGLASVVVFTLSGCFESNNDCNESNYFPDNDGDGFGASSGVQIFCQGEQPANFVLNDTDPDDTDPTNGIPPELDVELQFGTVSQLVGPDFTMHAYVATVNEQHVSAYSVYVVEGSESVFIMDLGIDPDIGTDIKAITDAIGKPIEGIIISHAHPDHVGGIASFPNIPTYATPITAAILEVGIPSFFVPAFPDINVLPLGENTMAGITFNVDRSLNTEASENAIIDFGSEAGMVFVNDLLFIEEHAFIGQGSVNQWLEDLAGFTVEYGDYDHVLTGHGGVGDADSVIAENIVYFNKVLEQFAAAGTFPDFAGGLATAYPTYSTEGIYGFSKFSYWVNHLQVPDTISVAGDVFLEGLAIVGTTTLFTSNFTTGDILTTNYKLGTSSVFAPAPETDMTGWGLAYHPASNQLYSIKNGSLESFQAYFADPVNNTIPGAGQLDIYNASTSELVTSVTLPNGIEGNSVTVDADGNAYITDFSTPRILKYDVATNQITVWADTNFVFLGGVVLDEAGNVYVHGDIENTLLKIVINEDGSAGAQSTIHLTGEALIAGDGLTYAGNNTLFSTSNVNSVLRITLDGEGGGIAESVTPTNLDRFPTSLATLDLSSFIEARNFLFINDGQLGTPLFGTPGAESSIIRVVRY